MNICNAPRHPRHIEAAVNVICACVCIQGSPTHTWCLPVLFILNPEHVEYEPTGDNLHEMSKPVFWRKKQQKKNNKKTIIHLSFAELFYLKTGKKIKASSAVVLRCSLKITSNKRYGAYLTYQDRFYRDAERFAITKTHLFKYIETFTSKN